MKTPLVLIIARVVFCALCFLGSWTAWQAHPEHFLQYGLIAGGFAALVLLVDFRLQIKSLRPIVSMAGGLAVGIGFAALIVQVPFVAKLDSSTIFMARMLAFAVGMYWTVAAVSRMYWPWGTSAHLTQTNQIVVSRGESTPLMTREVAFSTHESSSKALPLVIVDTSILIDGRIVGVCEAGFLPAVFIIPRFVLEEIQRVADSNDLHRQSRGRRGLETLNRLKSIPDIEVRIHECVAANPQEVDGKILALAQSMKTKLFTTDYSLAQLAQFQGLSWLNLHALTKALSTEVCIGDILSVELVKPGREAGQAVGYLSDGSMVVVVDAADCIGQSTSVEVVSVLPSAGGRMVFARKANSEESNAYEPNTHASARFSGELIGAPAYQQN
jgi:uncharacterized protein YacL